MKNANLVHMDITDKKFCLTGTLSMKRAEVASLIEDAGGIIVSTVSKKTDYLIVGEDAGSKLDKAEELGVAILNENQLQKLLEIK